MTRLCCPWCGAGGDSLGETWSNQSRQIYCRGCGAKGPEARYDDLENQDSDGPRERAVELWNTGFRYAAPRLKDHAELLETRAKALVLEADRIRRVIPNT